MFVGGRTRARPCRQSQTSESSFQVPPTSRFSNIFFFTPIHRTQLDAPRSGATTLHRLQQIVLWCNGFRKAGPGAVRCQAENPLKNQWFSIGFVVQPWTLASFFHHVEAVSYTLPTLAPPYVPPIVRSCVPLGCRQINLVYMYRGFYKQTTLKNPTFLGTPQKPETTWVFPIFLKIQCKIKFFFTT